MDSLNRIDRSAAPEDLDLAGGLRLGTVDRIDPSRLEVGLSAPDILGRVTVSDIVAVPVADDFVVGLIDRTQRGTESPDEFDRNGAPRSGSDQKPSIRVIPIGTFHSLAEDVRSAFTRGISRYPYVGADCHLIEGERLQRFMASLGEGIPPEERLVLGRFAADGEAIAIADGNRLFQRHVALLGNTGSGKSWAVAQMLERASRLRHPNLIVFDLHGEYGSLSQPVDAGASLAHAIRVAGPSDPDSGRDDLLYLPHWLLRRDELLALVLNRDDPYASDQVLRLSEHIQALKHVALLDVGRDDAALTFSVDSPIPYRLEHLVTALKTDDSARIVRHPNNHVESGPYAGHLTGLITRLEARAADPRFAFIFDPPAHTFDHQWLTATISTLLGTGPDRPGIKIIDLSEVPSSIVPLVVGALARLVYDAQFWINPEDRTPISLVCDEAHLYLPSREDTTSIHAASLETFESIAKEGRKYGVGLLVVSQRPGDVSRTILSQCNNFVIMRLTNDHDREMVERLVPETLSSLMTVLPALDVGEAIVIGDALLLPTRLKLHPPFIAPTSATQPYWSLWADRPSSPSAIEGAVDALQTQMRRK